MDPTPDSDNVGGGAKEDEASVKDEEKKENLVPLNLPLTSTPEFIKLIEFILKRDYPCPHQQQNLVKPKAMNFPISKITIGEWTSTAVYRDDLTAKFYFARKTLMWELFEDEETGVARVKRKIEILWDNVLSFRATFHPHDGTGILQLELGNRPTFFLETNPLARTHSIWKQMDQDFTLNQSASKCRRHTLHFSPGVLQKNLGKVVSIDTFWSKLVRVTFPTLPQSLYFDIPYGNNNNKKPRYGQCQTRNNDLFHYHPQVQGLDHVPVGEVNSNVATQFCANDWRQINSFVQDNRQNKTMNQLPETQVIQPSSQPINRGRYFSRSQLPNPMIQDERQMRNTGELRGSQTLLETQTNSMIYEHANEISTYQVGPNLGGYLVEEGETQNMEHTHLDGNSQTDSNGSVANEISTYQVGLNLGGYLAEEGETQNMEHAHLDANSQTNSNGSVENEISTYQVGPNLGGYLAEEGETQNMEHTHLDGNSQTDSNGSVPPDL